MKLFRRLRALRRRFGLTRAPIYPAYQVRGVLAGRYRGADLDDRPLLTHALGTAANGDEAPKSLCNKILNENLVDSGGGEPPGSIPTCTVCRERLAKIGAPTT